MYVFKEIFIARETHEKLFYVTFIQLHVTKSKQICLPRALQDFCYN